MWWKGRRRSRLRSQMACEALVAQALNAHSDVVGAVRAGVTAKAVPLVDIVITRLLWLVWDLPNWNEKDEAFGFFRSRLDTAARALNAFEQSTTWWDHAPSLVARHQMEPLWRAGVAIGGLILDAGRLADVTVRLASHTSTEPTSIWAPLESDLLVWLDHLGPSGGLPETSVSWDIHSALPTAADSVLMTHLLLPAPVTRALSQPVAQALWDIVYGQAGGTNLLAQLLGRCAAQPPSDEPLNTPPQVPSIASHVLTALQAACYDGTLEVNQYPGQVFVRETETWVVVPKTLNILRRRLRAEGVGLPDNATLYQALQAHGWLVGDAAKLLWELHVPGRPGHKPVRLGVVRLRNPVLWADDVPEPFTAINLSLAEVTA